MPTEGRRRRHRRIAAALGLVSAGVVLVAGLAVLFGQGVGPLATSEGCRARVNGVVVDLSTEQAENASTISAVAVRRGLPARAASIALAAAFQESKLRNLDHGDRDSVGIFQQRPSQGWGTAKQIRDPYYAVNRFYDALQRINGYQQMRITEAAQKVQRSGYPEAYAAHEADARALASALSGNSPAAFTCVVTGSGANLAAQKPGATGLTPRAAAVRSSLVRAFGSLRLGGYAAGGVSQGRGATSAQDTGRALDVLVRPVSPDNRRTGWAIAGYLVAQAARLRVEHVIFDGRIWSAGALSDRGWRAYRPSNAPGSRVALEHRDRVHVDVVAGR